MRAEPIFHITTQTAWTKAEQLGKYLPAGFARDGFVHCSYASQVVRVANFLFQNESDLVLLEIDSSLLDSLVVDENLDGGEELFPHVYSPVKTSAVVKVHNFPCSENGSFELPTAIRI